MGLQHSDPRVLRKSLCHIIDAATMLHLELFQMAAPLYVSGLLLRVIRIGVKACIDINLYAELFITSIIEKHVLIYSKDNFDHCLMILSWIILVPLD
mgnify:CR=1 FL=1